MACLPQDSSMEWGKGCEHLCTGWYLRLRDTLPAGKTVFNLISKILAEDEIQEPVFSIGMDATGP